jgi:hypothetical protein
VQLALNPISRSDEQERSEVEKILSVLPGGHPARKAFAAGEPAWQIARKLRHRPDLALLLSRAVAGSRGRLLERARRGPFAGSERRQISRRSR